MFTVVTERLSDSGVQNLQLSLNATLHFEHSEETFSNLTANTKSRSVCFFTSSLKLILSEQNEVADKVVTSPVFGSSGDFFLFFILPESCFANHDRTETNGAVCMKRFTSRGWKRTGRTFK